jgi:hypothetical protein
MFHEADLHGRLLELLQLGPESYDVSKGELLAFGESFFRENGRDTRLFDMAKMTALLAEKVGKPAFNIMRDGHRKEGWRGVRLVPSVPLVGTDPGPILQPVQPPSPTFFKNLNG